MVLKMTISKAWAMDFVWSSVGNFLLYAKFSLSGGIQHGVLNIRYFAHFVIQFPPEMDENWVRYGLAKLGQISRTKLLSCAYTTQLLHSTGEVCWNNKDSYFIWFEFVCRNSGQIASRRSWKRSCLGLEYTSKCSRLALLWEPN